MKTLKAVKEELHALEVKVSKLQKEKEFLENLTQDRRLAIELHTSFCDRDHEGAMPGSCNWHYEIHSGVHDWEQYEHKRYIEKANKLLKITNANNIQERVIFQIGEIIQK